MFLFFNVSSISLWVGHSNLSFTNSLEHETILSRGVAHNAWNVECVLKNGEIEFRPHGLQAREVSQDLIKIY